MAVPQDYLDSVRERSWPLLERAADIIAGRSVPTATEGSSEPVEGRFRIVRRELARGPAPTVSVVIPTFDRPALLADALDSVGRQRAANVEIVVVNDSETPLASWVVDVLFAGRLPLTIVHHHGNRGLGAARNTGAALARGKWLMMLDDDDELVEDGIRRLLDHAESGEPAIVFGDHLRQWYDGAQPRGGLEYRRTGDGLRELHIENPMICGSFMIRRDVFAALGGYREDLPVHEDYNLHVRALSLKPPAYVEAPISVYHCRTTLARLNHQRLHWFGTAALNHAIYRVLFRLASDERGKRVKIEQRENQYAHLARSLAEGCPIERARATVDRWWEALSARGLDAEIAIDERIIATACPAIAR